MQGDYITEKKNGKRVKTVFYFDGWKALDEAKKMRENGKTARVKR